jgi:hypothetical protein
MATVTLVELFVESLTSGWFRSGLGDIVVSQD